MAPWEPDFHKWTWSRLRQPIHPLLTLTLVFSLLSSVHAQYFVVNQPSTSTSWANGSPYPFSWTKGLLDGINSFDVELTRLSADGLIFVAKNVPATYNTLNILLQDVPAGDDYFLLCVNSTHGLVYSVSSRFAITNSSSPSNPSPSPSVPTVTVSGSPDPLKHFATTLGPASNAGISLIFPGPNSPNTRALGFGGILVLCAAFLGGAMTLW
ncbi:hypothetical protein HD554DRAFT_2068872 [Boletus coccyginus]|nr:hypothetical protein HD554DRAFT_2068872 [Boletus coccyginus]